MYAANIDNKYTRRQTENIQYRMPLSISITGSLQSIWTT